MIGTVSSRGALISYNPSKLWTLEEECKIPKNSQEPM